jgi:hypothetical protein
MRLRHAPFGRFLPLGLFALAGCSGTSAPSDDPADYDVDTSVSYKLEVSPPRWVVPSAAIPPEARVQPSNNNLDLEHFEDRLFLAWRTGPTHFADSKVELHVVSSIDGGETWEHETTIAIGADLREPRFVSLGGTLHLYYFEAGADFYAFRPKRIWRITRSAFREWSAPAVYSEKAEVHWDTKVRGGVAYMSSYVGNHYLGGESAIDVFLKRSTDGITWTDVDSNKVNPYHGGVSEVAFELDEDQTLWVITRNEDGDDSGFGSHLCSAPSGKLADWSCPARCDPERYDSPKMIRHGKDLYVIARHDIGGPFDEGRDDLSMEDRRRQYALDYWNRPKRTAIYQIDKTARKLVHLLDLPSAGDTAYPAVRRTGAHTFLIGNYTSPPSDADRSWFEGQTAEEGTQIYFVTLTFAPES